MGEPMQIRCAVWQRQEVKRAIANLPSWSDPILFDMTSQFLRGARGPWQATAVALQ
jgi:hypothetical protein